MIRSQAVHSVELRFQGDLVRRLVGGSILHTERTLSRTRSFGWRLDGPVVVLVTSTETVADASADPTRALDVLDRFADGWRAALEAEVSGAAVAGLSTEIVTVLPLDGRPPEDVTSLVAAVSSRVNGRLRLVGRVVSTGMSRPAGSLSGVRRGPPAGPGALGVGQEIHGPASVTHFDQLGVFRLLSLIPDSTELRTYVDEVLGPLADATDPDSADLRETLRVLLETNLNVAESARRLHFHYNTMRYRIGKLERMLGPFTTDPTCGSTCCWRCTRRACGVWTSRTGPRSRRAWPCPPTTPSTRSSSLRMDEPPDAPSAHRTGSSTSDPARGRSGAALPRARHLAHAAALDGLTTSRPRPRGFVGHEGGSRRAGSGWPLRRGQDPARRAAHLDAGPRLRGLRLPTLAHHRPAALAAPLRRRRRSRSAPTPACRPRRTCCSASKRINFDLPQSMVR